MHEEFGDWSQGQPLLAEPRPAPASWEAEASEWPAGGICDTGVSALSLSLSLSLFLASFIQV